MYLNEKERELVTRLEKKALYNKRNINYETVRQKIYNEYINYESKLDAIETTHKKHIIEYKNGSSNKVSEDGISDENYVYRPSIMGVSSRKEESYSENNLKFNSSHNSNLNNSKKPPKNPNTGKKGQMLNNDLNYNNYNNSNMLISDKNLSDS